MEKYLIILMTFLGIEGVFGTEPCFRFINSTGAEINNGLLISADYLQNFSYYPLYMDDTSEHLPSYDKRTTFHLYRFSTAYEKIYFEYGIFYDPEVTYKDRNCNYRYVTYKTRYLKAVFRLKRTKYADISFSIFSYKFLLGTLVSKNFQKFKYSIHLEKYYLAYGIIGIPNSISVAYSPLKNIWVFNEVKIHKTNVVTRPGYMNILGISYTTSFLSATLFYNIMHDGFNYYKIDQCSMSADDCRFGFQVKFETLFFRN